MKEKQANDVATTIAAINGTIARITAAHQKTGRVPDGALQEVQEAAAQLEKMRIDSPTLAAAVGQLIGDLRTIEARLTAI